MPRRTVQPQQQAPSWPSCPAELCFVPGGGQRSRAITLCSRRPGGRGRGEGRIISSELFSLPLGCQLLPRESLPFPLRLRRLQLIFSLPFQLGAHYGKLCGFTSRRIFFLGSLLERGVGGWGGTQQSLEHKVSRDTRKRFSLDPHLKRESLRCLPPKCLPSLCFST